MSATAYYERRKKPFPIEFPNRRMQNERREDPKSIDLERRRPATAVRITSRRDIPIPVKLHIDGQESIGITRDISPYGIKVESEINLPPSTPLNIQLIFGGRVAYMNLSGRVVFCLANGSKDGNLHIAGIKFSGLREWEEKVVVSVIESVGSEPKTGIPSGFAVTISRDHLAEEAAYLPISAPENWSRPSANVRRSCFHSAKITGWGAYLPPREISSQDLTSIVDTPSGSTRFGKTVEKLTGIKSRHYAESKAYPSDLAVKASEIALKNAGIQAKDVEVIIFCGVSRDVEEPATANIIQERLGSKYAYVFDLSNACNGFVSGLDVLDSFIASNRCEAGLVVAGEVLSQYVNFNPSSKDDLFLSAMGYTLGDGAGAAVLQRAGRGEEQGIKSRWFLADGNYWKVAVVPLIDSKGRRYFKSNGAVIEQVSLKYVPGAVEETMEMLGWSIDDIDLILPHQVSNHIIENLFLRTLGFPREKVYWSFPGHGNVGAASMPIAMYNALIEGRAKSGDKILLVGGSGGFGIGVLGLVL